MLNLVRKFKFVKETDAKLIISTQICFSSAIPMNWGNAEMKLFTITVLLLTFTQIKGQTEQSACGIVGPNLIPLMTNANHTHRRWPWHSAIYHRYSEADPIYKCGGTVISSNEILTAAHCVSKNGVRMESKHILVSLGSLFLNATESRGAQSYDVIFNLIM